MYAVNKWAVVLKTVTGDTMKITSIMRCIAVAIMLIMQTGYAGWKAVTNLGYASHGTETPSASATICEFCKKETPNKPALKETRAILSCGHCFHQGCLMHVFSISGRCSNSKCGKEIDIEARRKHMLIKYNESDPALKLIALAEYGNADEIAKMLLTENFADVCIADEPALAVALYKAAYMNHRKLVTLLLDFSDRHRDTVPLDTLAPTSALKVAIEDGRIETVKLLLARVDNFMWTYDALMRKRPSLDYAIRVAQHFGRHKIEALVRAKLAGESLEDVDLAAIAEDTPMAATPADVAADVPMVAAPVEDLHEAADADPEDDVVRLLTSKPQQKRHSFRSKITPKWFKAWRAQRRERAYSPLA